MILILGYKKVEVENYTYQMLLLFYVEPYEIVITVSHYDKNVKYIYTPLLFQII